MKKYIYTFAFAFVALFCATSCSNDDEELSPEKDSS